MHSVVICCYDFVRHAWLRRVLFQSLSIGLILVHPAAGLQQSKSDRQSSASFKDRAMNAAEQLREYHHRISALKKNSLRDISTARKEIEVKIDRSAKTSSTIFYYDNFEAGIAGWTTRAYTGSDIWQQTTLNASSATHSWWPGIASQANYYNGTRINNAVISPAISLAGAVGPVALLFAENFLVEYGWDFCMVDVSADGGATWTPLRGGYGSAPTGDTRGWQVTTLNLSPYSGQTINIRFYFDTGDSNYNEFPGWFVDDVVIFDQRGTIVGRKYFDENNNGIIDKGERGIKDWYITAAGPVTITTRTNDRGRYVFMLPLGSYALTEASRTNWTQTYPRTGEWDINLATPDTLIDSLHFGNYTRASFIKGIKYNDKNRNGINDEGDSLIADWKIVLADTEGHAIDFDRTDATGIYELFVFQPGLYVVHEVGRPGWIQTDPPGGTYLINIPDLTTTIIGQDFGNYYSDSVNTIMGQKFEDLNRNSIQDPHEPGIPHVKIQLAGTQGRVAVTDSNGYYRFLSLPPGGYRVSEVPQIGWWQSYPGAPYTVYLKQSDFIDTLDFGNYQIAPGSISGMKFLDDNNNGAKDAGEGGLPGWRLLLHGVTYFNSTVNRSTITDGSGNYSVSPLWPGTYTVSEVWRNGWTQTYPAALGVHQINLGVEENRTGIDFGNLDSVLSIGTYRTFTAESLAFDLDKRGAHKPVPYKPDKDEFCISFHNTLADLVNKVRIHFTAEYAAGTLSATHGGFIIPIGTTGKVIEIIFASPLASGEEVTVCGLTLKPKEQTVSRWFLFFGAGGVAKGEMPTISNYFRYPMPNAVNLLEIVGRELRVGLGGPHSVVHVTYRDVIKSLFEKPGRMHVGDARCLDNLSGLKPKPIKKQQRYLNPSKHNNKLLAEAIALQTNILGSDNGNTPAGFGNLIFDEGTGVDPSHPLNGMPIRTIAAALDSFMSSPIDTGINAHGCQMPEALGSLDPESLFVKIRMINGAFSGPIDTTSFAFGLAFKGVHQISEVPFLRYDPIMGFKSFSKLPPLDQFVPDERALYQNYPNPFNPTTTISFTLDVTSFVTLKVYNILGQEVAALLTHESMDEGMQDIDFDANALPSGVYFYHLVAEGIPDEEGGVALTFSSMKKMLLVK